MGMKKKNDENRCCDEFGSLQSQEKDERRVKSRNKEKKFKVVFVRK